MSQDFDAIRFGKAECRACGHHPIMHLTKQEILTGEPGPCTSCVDEGRAAPCMGYVPSSGDEPSIVPMKDGRDVR